ncbi:MAG: MotA/TolQ/ExbB proton channel family protein [Bdellovibrio sp.]|nr:MotA/TolQ/ExbB proton channel family protein [Bdellovibrio sp.]
MNLWVYIQEGGAIMYVLLFLNIIGLGLMAFKLFTLYSCEKSIAVTAQTITDRINLNQGKERDPESKVQLAKQELNTYMAQAEKGINAIRLIAAISPLLGLLGTVVGVYMAFKLIAVTGMSNPSQFAEGLSLALITTVGGLIVAIPHYIGHTYLIGVLDRLEVHLERELTNRLL